MMRFTMKSYLTKKKVRDRYVLDNIPSGTKIFVDTNILYLFLRGHYMEDKSHTILRFMERLENRDLTGVTTVHILEELIFQLIIAKGSEIFYIPKEKRMNILKEYEKNPKVYLDVVKTVRTFLRYLSEIIQIYNITADLLFNAVHFMNLYFLKPSDALVVACMFKFRIKNIASNDNDFDRVNWIVRWRV